MRKYIWLAIALVTAACEPLPPPPPPPLIASWAVDAVACAVAGAVPYACQAPIAGATIQMHGLAGYVSQTANGAGYVVFQLPAGFADSDVIIDAPGYLTARAHIDAAGTHDSPQHNIIVLAPAAPPQPPLDKRDFIEHYQGNLGSIKLPGCGFFGDMLFDPVVLLAMWTRDKACFELAMASHAARDDNRVVVDPRSDYGGRQIGAAIDLWHAPQTFAAFLLAVRAHRNARGEPFKVLVFFSGDGHIGSFLKNGQEGVPDTDAEAHFSADVMALAAVTRDLIDGTVTCWECRHDRNYITPGGYERLGRIVAHEFPKAWHGQHLIQESSSWSSWHCDPDAPDVLTQTPPCTPANARKEGDDPNRGNEETAWDRCVQDGWCDGLLYQFHVGDEYLHPDDHPNYLTAQGKPGPGAFGRYWEIVVWMGNDPQSLATRGNDPRWPPVDILAFEHIFDAYNGRSTEAYGIAFCRRALAIGGWGCGSASVRR